MPDGRYEYDWEQLWEPAPAVADEQQGQAASAGRPPTNAVEAYMAAALREIEAELRASAAWPPGDSDQHGRGWDKLQADAALRLGALAKAGWNSLTLAEAEKLFKAAAPTDSGWRASDAAYKWRYHGVGKSQPAPEPAWHTGHRDELAGLVDRAQLASVSHLRPEPEPVDEATVDNNNGEEPEQPPARFSFSSGGSFILDTSPEPEPLWGAGRAVLLADGEALIIVGGQGLGKSTIAQQLALGRCGFVELATLLGFPVKPTAGRVLYLAMDRPKQISRSLARMVGEAWRAELDEHLAVWQGPPPHDLAKHPSVLSAMCAEAGADTVIVDSLKDAAIGLNDDEVGAGYNRARQQALADGVQVIELHHNRKQPTGKAGQLTLDDVYGSTWLTSGAGSVILLTGAPGDPIVNLHHIKQPSEEVGPLKVFHEHDTGLSSVWHGTDVVQLATAQPGGITAVDAARVLFDTEKPTANEKAKARRKLENAHRAGLLVLLQAGDPSTSTPALWGPK